MIDIKLSLSEQGEPVATLAGEWEYENAPYLRTWLEFAMEQDSGAVLVNLSKVDYLDSAPLGVLIGAHKRLKSEGRRLIIICPESGVVRRKLEVSGLLAYFDMFPTAAQYLREEGVKS